MTKIKIINNKKFVDMKSLFFCIIIIVLVIICVFVRIYIHNRKIQHAEDENGKAIDDNDVEVVEVEDIKVSELLKQKILDVIDEHIPFNTILTDVGLVINTGKNQFVLNGHSDRAHIHEDMSHWMWVKSIKIPSGEEILLENTFLKLQFKGRMVECDYIFHKFITEAIENLLPNGWIVEAYCAVAYGVKEKSQTTFVLHGAISSPAVTTISRNVKIDDHISSIYSNLKYFDWGTEV